MRKNYESIFHSATAQVKCKVISLLQLEEWKLEYYHKHFLKFEWKMKAESSNMMKS